MRSSSKWKSSLTTKFDGLTPIIPFRLFSERFWQQLRATFGEAHRRFTGAINAVIQQADDAAWMAHTAEQSARSGDRA